MGYLRNVIERKNLKGPKGNRARVLGGGRGGLD